jgi:hypothetical protein
MLRKSFVLGSAALACLTTAAAGQSMTPLRLGVALGTSFNRTSWAPYGGHAMVSLTSQSLGSRWGVRAEVLFEGGDRWLKHNQGMDLANQRNATVGLLISPTYRVWGKRTGLYVIAGLGLYHSSEEERHIFTGEVHQGSVTELGANAGLGIDFKLFGRDAFVESRLHSAAFRDRVPLTLGIRF